MDAPSIRPALMDMASRLATVGYYVMLPFLFYRGSEYREFGQSDEDMHLRRDLMATVSRAGIVDDAEALLEVAASDPAARGGDIGAVGFCMSGRLQLDGIRAEVYLGWPDQDPSAPREHIPIIEQALTEAGVEHRIDFMEGALHGFAPPGGERYDRAASEKHWERVFELFRRKL